MTRLRMIAAIAIPSMIIGGLVFRNTFGYAAAGTGDDRGYWPARDLVADATRPKRTPGPPQDHWATPPPPPTPPTPPRPPKPPRARGAGGNGVSISIHGDQIQITGIHELVTEHLEGVREMLRNNPDIPQDVRDKIVARMDKVKNVVDRRLKNLKTTDLDKLDDEMERMGEELERALEGLDKDLGKLGSKLARDVAKQVGKDLLKDLNKQKLKLGHDHDDSDDNDDNDDSDHDPDIHDSADPDADIHVDVGDLKGFALKPAQRDAIAKLRDDSEARVATVKKQLDDASHKLETALADSRTSDADVIRLVDQVSGHEAAIRKAKLLAWVQARRVLDADQVKKLETATRKPR